MGIAYVFEKIKLRTQLNRYLNNFQNTKDYRDAKHILESYYFHKDQFEEIKELNKEAGTFDLVQHQIDKFELYLKENNEKDEQEEEMGR